MLSDAICQSSEPTIQYLQNIDSAGGTKHRKEENPRDVFNPENAFEGDPNSKTYSQFTNRKDSLCSLSKKYDRDESCGKEQKTKSKQIS